MPTMPTATGSMQQAQKGSQMPKKPTKYVPKHCPKVSGVCLDYLKGRCCAKRFQCKFYHPNPADFPKPSGDAMMPKSKEICEVYALTKRCKFGDHCIKLHIAEPKYWNPHNHQPARAKAGKAEEVERQPSSKSNFSEPLDFEGMVASILQPLEGMDDDSNSLSQISSESSIMSSSFEWLNTESSKVPLPPLLHMPYQGLDQVFLDTMRNLTI